MTTTDTATRSLVIEREFAHPPTKIWRALTETGLIEQWLMKSDFAPAVGHQFHFRAEPNPHWNGVTACEVLVVEAPTRLVYTWNSTGENDGENALRTVVTWSLTPVDGGTMVRMEQSGFRASQEHNLKGAKYGWQYFVADLEKVVAEL